MWADVGVVVLGGPEEGEDLRAVGRSAQSSQRLQSLHRAIGGGRGPVRGTVLDQSLVAPLTVCIQ